MNKGIRISIVLVFTCFFSMAQDVALFEQFNGRFDYTAIGNTMNLEENQSGSPCEILTASSADLNLEPDQTILKAFLYWAGSGAGDFNIELNGNSIVPDRTYSDALDSSREFFAAVTDVTTIVQALGNGTYSVSELDVQEIIPVHCPNGTNFAGWSIIIIYEDGDLPLNQINLYEGLQSVPDAITINLESLNVLDDIGAKIGFLAWEGDSNISITESLRINGDLISNPPLNPEDNAFNGTNSFTGSEVLYNMDIDFYDIEDNIEPGDTSAVIELASGQDFVMINNIITVLNSQLPDATSTIDSISEPVCGLREITVNFTIYNLNSTDFLPAATPIAFFGDSQLLAVLETLNDIPIAGSESQTILLTIPESVPNEFTLRISADNTGSDVGIVQEILEDNNDDSTVIRLLKIPEIPTLENLEICDAVGIEKFNLTQVTAELPDDLIISFHLTEADAIANINAIDNPESYDNSTNPETIYVRVANADCFAISSFTIAVIVCPLPDATVNTAANLAACKNRQTTLLFTVGNYMGTALLPMGTPVSFYADGILIAVYFTPIDILAGASHSDTISLTFPVDLPNNFSLLLVADDDGNSLGLVEELDETNNNFKSAVNFNSIEPIINLPNLLHCDQGFDRAIFNLTQQNELISTVLEDQITYYTSQEEALNGINPIVAPQLYTNISNPQQIFVRLDTPVCFTLSSFLLEVENCPPTIPEGFSPNNDGVNDLFAIQGLLNVFPEHELLIYSRLGNLIFKGNNQTGHWNGIPNQGLAKTKAEVPVGVYYYVLYLNDSKKKVYTGWLYLNK